VEFIHALVPLNLTALAGLPFRDHAPNRFHTVFHAHGAEGLQVVAEKHIALCSASAQGLWSDGHSFIAQEEFLLLEPDNLGVSLRQSPVLDDVCSVLVIFLVLGIVAFVRVDELLDGVSFNCSRDTLFPCLPPRVTLSEQFVAELLEILVRCVLLHNFQSYFENFPKSKLCTYF
jgi:hypothetical protein